MENVILKLEGVIKMANKPKMDNNFVEKLIDAIERAGMQGMKGGMRAAKPSPRSKPSMAASRKKKKRIVGTQTTVAIRKKTSKRRKKKY